VNNICIKDVLADIHYANRKTMHACYITNSTYANLYTDACLLVVQ